MFVKRNLGKQASQPKSLSKTSLSFARNANMLRLRCVEICQPTLFYSSLRCESVRQLACQVGPSTHRLAVGELCLWQHPSRLLLASIRMGDGGSIFGGFPPEITGAATKKRG